MTFGEHLEELRRRLILGIVAFAVAFAAAFAFQDELLRFYSRPYEEACQAINDSLAEKWAARPKAESERAVGAVVELLRAKGILDDREVAKLSPLLERERREAMPQLGPPQAVSALETLSAYMLVCFVTALAVSGPILIHQIWKFVGEGLYETERRMILRVLPFSILLFFTGLAFAFFVMARMSVQFLVGYGDIELVRPQVTISSYLGLLVLLMVVMGLVFQIPLVMTVLSGTGLVSPDFYRGKRRHCILAIFIIAAIITPPDYVSQLLVAGPMLVLFEIGLWLAKGAAARRAQRGRDESPPATGDATK